jgi:hypothetical protein
MGKAVLGWEDVVVPEERAFLITTAGQLGRGEHSQVVESGWSCECRTRGAKGYAAWSAVESRPRCDIMVVTLVSASVSVTVTVSPIFAGPGVCRQLVVVVGALCEIPRQHFLRQRRG